MKLNEESIQKWNEYCTLKQWSTNTINSYNIYMKKLYGLDISQESINKFMVAYPTNLVDAFVSNLVKCFGLEKEIKIIKATGRKNRKQQVDHFTKPEMTAIYQSNIPIEILLPIRLMFECGLRVSEVCDLKRSGIDFINNRIKGKGKGKLFFNLPLYDDTKSLLIDYTKNKGVDDFIFRFPDIKHQRQKMWYEIKKEVSHILPYKNTDEIYPHAFRHSCATYLLEMKFNLREIQQYLRHENLNTIVHYTAINNAEMQNRLKKIF